MDSFTTGRRRATWQSKAPMWPFIAGAFAVTFIVCVIASPFVGGMILGDGTATGRTHVWIKAVSNMVIPAVVVGAFVGFLLHQFYLEPARRSGAMTWTGLLILAGALAGGPFSIVRAWQADRVGYALKLDKSVAEAQTASRKSEQDFYRRLYFLMSRNPFEPSQLVTATGLDDARKTIAGHRDLIATARRDYGPGQIKARKALADAIADKTDREAVLERFDTAALARKAMIERLWDAHDTIADLREQELAALTAQRGAWRKTANGVAITDQRLFRRIQALENGILEAVADADTAQAEIYRLDGEMDAGILRILRAAV